MTVSPSHARKGGIPRGLATDGVPLLSYGFRPFFLGAGIFAVIAMGLWIGALSLGWEVGGGTYGAHKWHAHEMLFGYAGAALAGFMLTAIPNWTGRLPVAGSKLLALVLLWLAGRVVMIAPDQFGLYPAALLDASFVPVLAVIAGREIVAGRNWKNLKIVLALLALSGINAAFHLLALSGQDPVIALRGGVAVFIALIALVGGRIVPSFTRNWLSRAGAARLPHPFDRFDSVAIAVLVLALAVWTAFPETSATAGLAALAAALQLWRLGRWRGYATLREPLLVVLHLAYLFVPLGMLCVALAALGLASAVSALHVLTVGAIGTMTMAMMTRATLGHTGRKLAATPATRLAYLALLVAAVSRPLAELLVDFYEPLLQLSGGAWLTAFTLFSIVYGRMLVTPRV